MRPAAAAQIAPTRKASLIAGIERRLGIDTAGKFEVRLSRREAREHGEAERAAHHERGVDDARGEARFARL